jgi:hypothetical protein
MGIPKYLESKIKSLIHCCGISDVPSSAKPIIKTNQTYNGKPVYEAYYTFSLTATSPYTITQTVGTLLGADVIATVGGVQFLLNGGTTTLANCDASVSVNAGNIIVDWTTTHAIGDTLSLYIKYTQL